MHHGAIFDDLTLNTPTSTYDHQSNLSQIFSHLITAFQVIEVNTLINTATILMYFAGMYIHFLLSPCGSFFNLIWLWSQEPRINSTCFIKFGFLSWVWSQALCFASQPCFFSVAHSCWCSNWGYYGSIRQYTLLSCFICKSLFYFFFFFYCAEINIDYSAQILLFNLLQKFYKEDESTTEPGRRFHSLITDGKNEYLYESIFVINCLYSVRFLAVNHSGWRDL